MTILALRGHNWVHFAHRLECIVIMNSNFAINLKLFSIRLQELFELIVLRKKKKKKGDGFLLFLKAFSWETDLWVSLGDFTVKTQNWEGKSVVNWKSIK